MITNTIRCKLLCKEDDINDYHTLVFKNLDPAPFGFNYVMCKVWPNWESPVPKINDVGYLTYNEVIGGKDTYYDPLLDKEIVYKFTNLVFEKFVKDSDNSEDVIL